MRKTWDKYFMDMAYMAATRSTCLKRHVGCIITKDHHILSTGYNGSLPGEPHCDEVGCFIIDGRCKRTIHAEKNALLRLPLFRRAGNTLYCTRVPCYDCAKDILKAGTIEVVYDQPSKSQGTSVALFEENGIVIRSMLSGATVARDPVKIEVIGSNPI